MPLTLKIALACAFGAGIGTLISLELGYFWWFGSLIGGLIGYLSYEPLMVVKAIKDVARRMIVWRPEKMWWKNFSRGSLVFYGVSTSLFIPLGISILILNVIFAAPSNARPLSQVIQSDLIGFYTLTFFGPIASAVILTLEAAFTIDQKTTEKWRSERIDITEFSKFTIFRFYGFYLWFWIGCAITFALMVVWVSIESFFTKALTAWWDGVKMIARFVRAVFIEIHSDARVLCFVDAMLGATAGYFAGSAIIGAVTGVVFGVLNYEVVSKKLLKLHLR